MSSSVYALTVYNGQVIAGGAFRTADGTTVNYVSSWDGSSWSAFGSMVNSHVYALTVYDSKLIAGGDFSSAGGASARRIASWNGSSWSPLGSGMNALVWSLAVYEDRLIAGGGFLTIDGVSLSYIASWDGSSWSALGSGMTHYVLALTVYDGQLIAGGYFTIAGGTNANYIASWDGSSWSALGSGMGGDSYPYVRNLTVYDGQLIAGGHFTTAGGTSVAYIASWNGSSWSSLGSGMNGEVNALTFYDGQLIAGGSFTTAGGTSANRIASWDGSSWSPLGSGMGGGSYPTVRSLTGYDGLLIAGGGFATAGGTSASRIAAWDGSSWSAFGSGMNGNVYALTDYDGQLIAGGPFTTAGNKVAAYLAAWNPNNCTYWTPGLDTVLYTAFEVELFDPTDSTGSLGAITAFGADMVVQRSEPYEVSPDTYRMDTDILAFSGSGDSPLLGGAFTIDLNPQETSGGYIQMCDSCNNNWAESHFNINYRINTSLPYPENTLYGVALMDLACDAQWDPLPPGDEPFTPPNGHDYIDPRKLPMIDANGDTVGYTMKRHRVDEDPFGSCCVLDASQEPVTSVCLIVTEAECDSAGGVYYGDNSICDPDGEDYDLDGVGDSCDQCDDFRPVIQNPAGDTLWVEFSDPDFAYCPEIIDPDNANHTINYTDHPDWCRISSNCVVADSVPDSVLVERLTVMVEDTCNVTTRSFIVAIYLCGDVDNNGGGPDIGDLTYLVDYMFQDGPPPPVMAAADCDASDDAINITDLMYLIEYMFLGGPPPVCLTEPG